MVRFLDPETAEILQFLDPEIVKMDKKISGYRNRRKGWQILYPISVQDAKQCRRRFFYSVKKKDSKCLAECFLMLLLQVKIRSHLKLTKLSKFSLALNPKKI